MALSDRPAPGDIGAALGLLTRLPVRAGDPGRGARAAWAWPVAGAAVAALAGGLGALAMALGVAPAASAVLALAAGTVLTGALHEDGLADCADGFWGGATLDRRLDIMRDSRIGTFGTVALILSFALRALALASLFAAGGGVLALIGAGALSRLPMVALSHALTPARPSGLSARVGRPSRRTLLWAGAATLAIALPTLGVAAPAAIAAMAVAGLIVARLGRAKIGGQTGDLLGAAQQVAEIAILTTLAAMV